MSIRSVETGSKAEKDLTPMSATGHLSNSAQSRHPLSAVSPGIRHSTQANGFSLLEVLVVVFIIGVLATMFTLSVGVLGSDRPLETEVKRLIAVIDLAREEAVIQGREIGIRFYPDSYEFATYLEDFVEYHDEENPDRSEWTLLEKSTLLGPRELPDGFLFELEIDGREIVLKDMQEETREEAADDADEEPVRRYEPQIMIFSSGDMSPFTIQVRRTFTNTGTTIEFDVDGTVETDEGKR